MKQILVIGSTVVDVIINLHHLPSTGEDVHVLKQCMSLGGCAYNTSHIIRHLNIPCILFSPVGTGVYGNYVRSHLAQKGIVSPIPTPDSDNGCCYCIVEHTGERTFISHHGAEYLFQKQWFELIDVNKISSIYLCGLEIEESTGMVIIDWLAQHRGPDLYFAPGPRINKIEPKKMELILSLSPVLHLNKSEALEYSGQDTVQSAAAWLFSHTGSTVIVTLGGQGAYIYASECKTLVPGITAKQVDTIGAGDSHIGAVMAYRAMGKSWPEAVAKANRISAAVVETHGALLPDSWFHNHLI